MSSAGVSPDRDIKALIAKHRAAIDEIRARALSLTDACSKDVGGVPWDGIYLKYDDVFFLYVFVPRHMCVVYDIAWPHTGVCVYVCVCVCVCVCV